jgi:hypothetical protein
MRCILSKYSDGVGRLNKLQAKVGNGGVIETLEFTVGDESWELAVWGRPWSVHLWAYPLHASLTSFMRKQNIL